MPKLGVKSRGEPGGSILQFPIEGRQTKPVGRESESLDLGAILILLLQRCRRKVAPDLSIRLSAGPAEGAMIARNEAAALDYVLREIVSNASRHSHPSGSPVEVTIECGISRDGEIVLDIGDDGVGLPADFAEWRDAGDGIVSVRYKLQQVGAHLNVTSDDLGLRFQIILHPRQRKPTPARGNFVWL